MKKLIAIILLFFIITMGFGQTSAHVEVLEPEEYKIRISEDPKQFIDIRTPEEFLDGHIEGAENIDFLADGFLFKMQKFDREEPVYIYCRSGNRSSKAAAQLSDMGFSKIIDLKGGYKAWTQIE